jgi:hypothetical protein
MARLKAHGTELLRIEREVTPDSSSSTIWGRETVAYMSDGKILSKIDVRFKPDRFDPAGRFHSYGWKLWKRVKPGVSIEEVVARTRAKIDSDSTSPWRIVFFVKGEKL